MSTLPTRRDCGRVDGAESPAFFSTRLEGSARSRSRPPRPCWAGGRDASALDEEEEEATEGNDAKGSLEGDGRAAEGGGGGGGGGGAPPEEVTAGTLGGTRLAVETAVDPAEDEEEEEKEEDGAGAGASATEVPAFEAFRGAGVEDGRAGAAALFDAVVVAGVDAFAVVGVAAEEAPVLVASTLIGSAFAAGSTLTDSAFGAGSTLTDSADALDDSAAT